MTDTPTDDAAHKAEPNRSALAILLGAVLGIVACAALVFVWNSSPRLPAIDQTTYDAARQTWQRTAIEDYNLEVRVEGNMPANYRVEVRGGQVIAASMNGTPQTQQRTWSVWSVPGMLSIIGQDLKAADASLVLRGQFDSETGLPRTYQRISLGGQSEVRWEVTLFERLPAAGNPSPANP